MGSIVFRTLKTWKVSRRGTRLWISSILLILLRKSTIRGK